VQSQSRIRTSEAFHPRADQGDRTRGRESPSQIGSRVSFVITPLSYET
jgi:hypothetical protein